MLPSQIFLVDSNPSLVREWKRCFRDEPSVQAVHGDYFATPSDAMVSPANSFGIMDGGLDLAIRDTLGLTVEQRVQERILADHHGELHVGQALIVPTESPRWPLLVAAPTMRVPADVSHTVNAYLAFRAILLAVREWNQSSETPPVQSLLCSGLGTGVGGMRAAVCALQMRMAYRQISTPAKFESFVDIYKIHRALRGQA